MSYSIRRSYKEFQAFLREETEKGVEYSTLAKYFGLNKWHISKMLNDPKYYPSLRVRRLCNISDRKPASRVILYAGSDFPAKAKEVEELTNGEWTLTRKVNDGRT